MNSKTFLTALVFCYALFPLAAENKNYGTRSYGKETISKIEIDGFAQLKGTQVTDHIEVNGLLKAEQAQIEKMHVTGQATLTGCLLKQKSVVYGVLNAIDSTFSEELSVSAEKTVFQTCSLNSLRILPVDGYYNATPVVELKGTKIKGSITFEGGRGKVIVDPKSVVLGEVKGGAVVFKK